VIGKLIDFILQEKLLVIAFSVILLVGGLFAFKSLNIEAYRSFASTIEVIAQNSGWSAEKWNVRSLFRWKRN
jgi:cobalt-zinc-cadmium resistance protein CzcA